MQILVTGSAGFIGSALVQRLISDSNVWEKSVGGGISDLGIVGLDNLNDYYDPAIKRCRLEETERAVKARPDVHYEFVQCDIADAGSLEEVFERRHFDIVVNLAAQAGVRYSIDNPGAYVQSNLVGFCNILEACRRHPVKHLVYASSSSVYGGNTKVPFSEDDRVDSPVSLYAATKKSNELLARAYSTLYGLSCTGLRFFTVYGPAGRPDMAYFVFTDRLVRGGKIRIYNHGRSSRDFTYIDDVVEAVSRIMMKPQPYAIYNVGSSHPENLMDFVRTLGDELIAAGVLPHDFDLETHCELVPMQAGDVPDTYADTTALERDFGFRPTTPLRDGLRMFARWYRNFYRI